MKLPMPCNCIVQNVDVDGNHTVIDQGQSMNNSVVQSVNINTPRGKLTEWFLIILLTVFLAVTLFLGFFMVSKSSIKSYLSFVQGTIQSMDAPTNKLSVVTNVVSTTVTNTVTNSIVLLDVPSPDIEISLFRWRIIDDAIHLKYALKNVSTNEVTNIRLIVNAGQINKTFKDVDDTGEPTSLASFKMKATEIIVPISTNQVTNVFLRVGGVQRKP